MPKSVLGLGVKQRKFLLSAKPLSGINKAGYQDDIEKKLKKSIETLRSILPYTRNLRKDNIYDIINANTLETIIQELIVDVTRTRRMRKIPGTKFVYVFTPFSYDFRTAEIARLLFEISASYLKLAPFVSTDKYLKEDIDKVSEHFYALTESILEKEVNKDLSPIDISHLKKFSTRFRKLKDDEIKKMFEGRKINVLKN